MVKTVSEKECLEGLETILQEELFSNLVGEKPTALKNNVQTGIALQNDVSERIYFLYKIIEHLKGAYTDQGIQRWFLRERAQLEKKSPLQYLGQAWKPQDEYAKKVLELAKSLNK